MTVTYYTADLVDGATDERHHGAIAWDKYYPRRLTATIGRVLADSTVDYPTWSGSAPNSRAGMETLIRRLKREAESAGLSIRTEKETRYAPKAP